MIWIEGHALPAVSVEEPGELHDRAAGGIEDCALDVAHVTFDPIGLSADDRYLRCRFHAGSTRASGSEQFQASRACRDELDRRAECLDGLDVDCLGALGPAFGLIGDLRALAQ